MKVKLSIIITTKNEEKVLEDFLESVKKQSFKNYEIVVVDNDSSDGTQELARKYTKNVFVKGPERSAQRNYGVAKAVGNVVIILDADMILSERVLEECAYEMSSQKFGALVIPEKSFGEGFWSSVRAFERDFYLGDKSIEAPRCFDRELFLRFGGYDENITGPEDYELPLRMRMAGIKIGRVKSYILHNERKFSPFKSAKKKFYYASRARIYLKKHPKAALSQGNLVFRPVFFRKWRKLVSHPILSLAMFWLKGVEFAGALGGVIYSAIIQPEQK